MCKDNTVPQYKFDKHIQWDWPRCAEEVEDQHHRDCTADKPL